MTLELELDAEWNSVWGRVEFLLETDPGEPTDVLVQFRPLNHNEGEGPWYTFGDPALMMRAATRRKNGVVTLRFEGYHAPLVQVPQALDEDRTRVLSNIGALSVLDEKGKLVVFLDRVLEHVG